MELRRRLLVAKSLPKPLRCPSRHHQLVAIQPLDQLLLIFNSFSALVSFLVSILFLFIRPLCMIVLFSRLRYVVVFFLRPRGIVVFSSGPLLAKTTSWSFLVFLRRPLSCSWPLSGLFAKTTLFRVGPPLSLRPLAFLVFG